MNILYVETETKLKKDLEWTWYLDNEETINVWNKYKEQCDKLTVVAPYEKEICTKGQRDLIKIGNVHALKDKGIELKEIEDINESKLNSNQKLKDKIIFNMEIRICASDINLVVIGFKDSFYKQTAIEICKINNKKYIIDDSKIAVYK